MAYSIRGNPHPLKTFLESLSAFNEKDCARDTPATHSTVVVPDTKHERVRFTRRNAISHAISGFAMLSSYSLTRQAQAACLMGDTSPDCIGIYKLPMDDAAMAYIDTPEKLRKNAPDLRWVPPVEYPKSYKDARAELNSLRQRCVGLGDVVLKGNLTEAGIELLGIFPRVTVAGRVAIRDIREAPSSQGDDMSMKAYRAEVAHTELLSRLQQSDLLMGQAIAGQLGASAPAQIQILSEIREANAFFDELVQILPEELKGVGKKSR